MDIENTNELYDYLRQKGWISADEDIETQILSGGVSNRTVLLRKSGRAQWVFKQALAKLRVEQDWFSEPRRIEHEARGIHHLHKILPPGYVPELVFTDPEHHLLCMTAVPEPHTNFKSMLLAGQIREEDFIQFGRTLAIIHRQGANSPVQYQESLWR